MDSVVETLVPSELFTPSAPGPTAESGPHITDTQERATCSTHPFYTRLCLQKTLKSWASPPRVLFPVTCVSLPGGLVHSSLPTLTPLFPKPSESRVATSSQAHCFPHLKSSLVHSQFRKKKSSLYIGLGICGEI